MNRIKRPLVWVAVCYIIFLLFWDTFLPSKGEILPPEEVSLNGIVTDIRMREKDEEKRYIVTVKKVAPPYVKLLLRMKQNVFEKAIFDEKQNVYLSPEIGDPIFFSGNFSPFEKSLNKGEFDAKAYYENEGYRGVVEVKKIQMKPKNLFCEWVWFLPNFLYKKRGEIVRSYRNILGDRQAGTLSAMILGDKSFLDEEVKTLYTDQAIGHLLAISGLHVSIIGLLFYFLLKKIRSSYFLSSFFPILFLILYGFFTGFAVSTERAVIMMTLFFLSQLFHRSYDVPSALSFAAIWILSWNHRLLYQASFQLSFGAVIAIFYGVKLGETLFLQPLKKDASFLKKGLQYGKSIFLATTVIQVFLLPFLLWHFYEITINGIVLNIIVLPFMGIVLITGFLGGVFSLFFEPIGTFFLGSAYVILEGIEWLGKMMSKNPFNKWILGRPSLFQAVFYFLILFLIMRIFWRMNRLDRILLLQGREQTEEQKERKMIRKWILVLTGFLLLVLIGFRKNCFFFQRLEVGKGSCKVLRTKTKEAYLIDCGSLSSYQVGKRIVVPYLKYYGISKINGCILSDFSEEKANGMIELLDQNDISIGRIIFPSNYRKKESEYVFLKTILNKADQKGVPVYYLKEEKTLSDGVFVFSYKAKKHGRQRKMEIEVRKDGKTIFAKKENKK